MYAVLPLRKRLPPPPLDRFRKTSCVISILGAFVWFLKHIALTFTAFDYITEFALVACWAITRKLSQFVDAHAMYARIRSTLIDIRIAAWTSETSVASAREEI